MLGQISLEGKSIVAEALLRPREVCQQIVDGGGDYLLPVKEKQPTLQRDLAEAFSPLETARGQEWRPGRNRNGEREGLP